jgi:betaine-homocysteine S-methyltransferase
VVLGDGGYLLELERRGYVQAGPFVPEVSLTRPEALAELHREFVRAGADVIQTLTFYASEDKLATVGLEGRVDDLNRAAVRIARTVASEGDVLVAGNLSETWAYDSDDPTSHRHVREMFDRQLAAMTEEGVDFVIAETFLWLGEALIAAEAIRATGLPAMITMAFDNDPNSYEGFSPGECARRQSTPSTSTNMPSQRAARWKGFGKGQWPATQMGILGRCRGRGRKVTVSTR